MPIKACTLLYLSLHPGYTDYMFELYAVFLNYIAYTGFTKIYNFFQQYYILDSLCSTLKLHPLIFFLAEQVIFVKTGYTGYTGNTGYLVV